MLKREKNKERKKIKKMTGKRKGKRKEKRLQHWRYIYQKCGGEKLMGKVEEQKESFIIFLIP